MRIISIVGSSLQKALLPLIQNKDLYSSVVFIVPKGEGETAEYIRHYLSQSEEKTKSGHNYAVQFIDIFRNDSYDDFYEVINDLLWKSFEENIPSIVNISGGTASMILAAVQSARDMRVPVMYVDSAKLNIQTINWLEDGIHTDIQKTAVTFPANSVYDLMALCNFYPSYLLTDETLPGIQYEREVFEQFETAKNNGVFDDVDRNIILTWNKDNNQKNEIDIVFLRNQIIGFISVKSGKGMTNDVFFKQASRQVQNVYPQWLLKLPCLRVLICKYPVGIERKKQLFNNHVLLLDNIQSEQDINQAIDIIVKAADKISESRQHPGYSFYEQFPEYSDERNEL